MLKLFTFSLFILVVFTCAASAQSNKYIAVQPGKWNAEATWAGKVPELFIAQGDTVVLARNVILDQAVTVEGLLIIEEDVTIYSSESLLISEAGRVENKGQLMLQSMENNGMVNNYSKLKVMEGITGQGSMKDINGVSTAGIID